jgi:hypothetical protein
MTTYSSLFGSKNYLFATANLSDAATMDTTPPSQSTKPSKSETFERKKDDLGKKIDLTAIQVNEVQALMEEGKQLLNLPAAASQIKNAIEKKRRQHRREHLTAKQLLFQ